MTNKRVHIEEEWKLFVKNARRFDNNPPEKRYGIVNPSIDKPTSDKDMLYASDPLELHNLHYDNYPPIAVRKYLELLELAEGKR